jgi:hypothetical protein
VIGQAVEGLGRAAEGLERVALRDMVLPRDKFDHTDLNQAAHLLLVGGPQYYY